MTESEKLVILDLATGASREVTTHGRRLSVAVLDPTGTLIISGDYEGVVRVGPISGEEPHLLLGATWMVESLAVSPDGRWVAAAAGEEISLWPMPDLAKPPLHTQPLPQLLATLDSFTNQRVVADAVERNGLETRPGAVSGVEGRAELVAGHDGPAQRCCLLRSNARTSAQVLFGARWPAWPRADRRGRGS